MWPISQKGGMFLLSITWRRAVSWVGQSVILQMRIMPMVSALPGSQAILSSSHTQTLSSHWSMKGWDPKVMGKFLSKERVNNVSRDGLNFKIRISFLLDWNLGLDSVCFVPRVFGMCGSMFGFLLANQSVEIWGQVHLITYKWKTNHCHFLWKSKLLWVLTHDFFQ